VLIVLEGELMGSTAHRRTWQVVSVVVAAAALVVPTWDGAVRAARPTSSPPPSAPVVTVDVPAASVTPEELRQQLVDVGVVEVELDTPPTGVLDVTSWQLDNMVAEVHGGGGLAGSDLDALAPLPEGSPPVSYLLAAWLARGGTARSDLARGWYHADAAWTEAPLLTFSRAAISLFLADVADLMANEVPPLPDDERLGVVDGDDPAGWQRPGATGGPCSVVQGFLTGALSSLFEALKVSSKFEGGSVLAFIGNALTGLWNFAIDLAANVVGGLVNTLTAPVVSALGVAFAALGVISQVTTLLGKWALRFETPDGTDFVANGAIGHLRVVTTGDHTDWPPLLDDCAKAFTGKPLPKLLPVGAPVDWVVGHDGLDAEGSPLLIPSDVDQAIPESGPAEMTFSTRDEGQLTGEPVSRIFYVRARVRPGEFAPLRELGDRLVKAAAASITDVIPVPEIREIAAGHLAAMVQRVMTPFTDAVGKLNDSFGVHAAAWVEVTYHRPPPSTSPSTTAPPDHGAFCTAVATYIIHNEEIVDEVLYDTGSGAIATYTPPVLAAAPAEIADAVNAYFGSVASGEIVGDVVDGVTNDGNDLMTKLRQGAVVLCWVADNCLAEQLAGLPPELFDQVCAQSLAALEEYGSS